MFPAPWNRLRASAPHSLRLRLSNDLVTVRQSRNESNPPHMSLDLTCLKLCQLRSRGYTALVLPFEHTIR